MHQLMTPMAQHFDGIIPQPSIVQEGKKIERNAANSQEH